MFSLSYFFSDKWNIQAYSGKEESCLGDIGTYGRMAFKSILKGCGVRPELESTL
jgi:hypothetical protein